MGSASEKIWAGEEVNTDTLPLIEKENPVGYAKAVSRRYKLLGDDCIIAKNVSNNLYQAPYSSVDCARLGTS